MAAWIPVPNLKPEPSPGTSGTPPGPTPASCCLSFRSHSTAYIATQTEEDSQEAQDFAYSHPGAILSLFHANCWSA
ncbi:hypothetical protein Y1Q_0024128 [Alligator mississippiensis]|uniref:Uncharacterized protein n=1 Tax=Alligator mississippiensis TaxID=8496 RepID=A0A151NHX8_ALLMI|nr:hypothetical protein Y1Q_0024128 [Alligator mississippiensis]